MYNNTTTVNLSNDTYIVIDRDAGFVSVNQGQQDGLDSDWGGQVVAFLTLAQAEAIAQMLYVPWSQPDSEYADVEPAENRDDYIGS